MSTSSRAMSAIPMEEQPILESLINIRNRLTALKKDSSHYIKPQDVQHLYQAVIKQVTRLNAVRDEKAAQNIASGATRPTRPGTEAGGEPDATSLISTNRVDTTLNDVFTLLSLFFLTIGKSRETPATFSQLGCMKQLLDHLAESGIYTEGDLQPFSKRLAELWAIVRKDAEQGKHPPQLTKLMMRKLEGCEKVLRTLEGTLSVLSVELVPIHQRLVSVRRQIAAAAAKPKPVKTEIKALQEELRKIDSIRVDGKFLGPGGSSVPAGQAILVGILEDCFEIVHDINVRNDEVPMTLQPIYDRLSEIKSQLEHLVLTHRWTLRETDLWNYQVTLKEIDRLRVDGRFVDSEGKQPEGQLVLLYLLRRCYGLIYRLVASSEPISEELTPISNKLSTISKCLKEVSKYGGPFTMRDLYPYRLALHQIDGMRTAVKDKDGNDTDVRKWLGREGSIPEGQAIIRAQYEEVEQTITEMLNREEEEEEDDDDDGNNAEEEEEQEWNGSGQDTSSVEDSSDEDGSEMSHLSPGLADASFPASPALEDSREGLYAHPMSSPIPSAGMTSAAPLSMGAALASAFAADAQKTPTAGSFASSDLANQASSVSSPTGADLPLGAAPLAATDLRFPAHSSNMPDLSCKSNQPSTPSLAGFNSSKASFASQPAPILDSNESTSSNDVQPPSSIEALAATISGSLRVE
ncbi:hypothetical protein CBS101457_005940 [Exobasidium rhododendri]|nr:hypothetical protein CBS101457_005940 [Exobasidium rhododendri]